MNSYQQYKISLRVWHPSMDPAEITRMLGFPPSRSGKAHEPRNRPSGQLLQEALSKTYWTATVAAGECPTKKLPTAIAELLDQLESRRSFLAKIRAEGGIVEFFVGWFLDGSTGDVFDCELLARIADLKVNLSLDVYPHVYPPDTTPVNLPIYKTIGLPDGRSRILLFDSPAGNRGRLENLICIEHGGDLIWTARLPTDTLPDAFLSARMEGEVIIANTSSSFAVTIDPKTGKTLSCIFTK
jgi:Domain of unknown function (DUF4279)